MDKAFRAAQQNPFWDQALFDQFQAAFAGIVDHATRNDAMPLADWKELLAAPLAACEQIYQAQPDDHGRRRVAAQAFETILTLVATLPNVGHAGNLECLKGISDFLDDLDRWRAHPWSRTGAGRKRPPLSSLEEQAWSRIVLAVEALRDAGVTQAEACRFVAAAIPRRRNASAKALARLPAFSTIKDRHNEYLIGEYIGEQSVRQSFDDYWQGRGRRPVRCPHGDKVHACEASGGGRCSDIAGVSRRLAKHLVARI